MGSVGSGFDNAISENFFATLECELLGRSTFRARAKVERTIFEFIEGWCNPNRRYSSPGYELLSNLVYEAFSQAAFC